MEVRFWRWSGSRVVVWLGILGCSWFGHAATPSGHIRLATYNVENYLLTAVGTRGVKPEASRDKVAEVLKACAADVVALQEIGGEAALSDLKSRLQKRGLEYPHQHWVRGADTNIQVALLSRWPLVRRDSHTQESYLLSGRRFRVSRGFLEAEVQGPGGYALTVFVAHLKSRRTSAEADESEMRRQEAELLRHKVEARLAVSPRANVVVMGDLNDTKDSEPIRLLLGRGAGGLVDTRPAERNGDTGYSPNPRWQPRTVTWTHHYGVEDSYSRVDYILLHANTAREWVKAESFIPVVPDWGQGSDHRPVVVTVLAKDR